MPHEESCTRCGATMVNEMEKSGIPTALITNMTAVARSIGSPRVIPGIAINNPCSDIDLPMEEQLKMRRNYIDRALKAVSAEVSGQEFF